MKYRDGFVSNSSASSFIIKKKYIDPNLLEPIKNHYKIMCKTSTWITKQDEWKIEETPDEIKGTTIMDNLDMRFFLENVLGISPEKIDWDDSYEWR